MHLLIPFAAPPSDAGLPVLRELELPHLARWTGAPPQRDDGDARSLSPPHERAQARAIGMTGADGELPWAAHLAARDGIDVGARIWGLLTPVHWHVGTDQVTVLDPADLQLDEPASRSLLDALRPLLEDAGYTVAYGAPLRWYVAHDALAGLATASLDRVIGRSVDAWMPPRERSRALRRLLNELQMALHAHPLNDAREELGLAVVNSVWLSGCGVAQRVTADEPHIDDSLRRSALAGDWGSWLQAWRALDAGGIAALQPPARLTLCGERAAATWTLQPPSLWQRLTKRRVDVAAVLESL